MSLYIKKKLRVKMFPNTEKENLQLKMYNLPVTIPFSFFTFKKSIFFKKEPRDFRDFFF